MFRSKKKRRGAGQDGVMADIGSLADDSAMPDGCPPDESGPGFTDTGPSPDALNADDDDGIPASIPEDQRELMRASRQSREAARAKNQRDDQTRQTVFACACVVAGFCGIAGVIFGTVAVCSHLALGPGNASASEASAAVPYTGGADPSDMNVYYDEDGQMHVNVYVERQPEVDINIRIDGEGNVTSETVPREETQEDAAGADDASVAQADGAGAQDGENQEGQESTDNAPGSQAGSEPQGGDDTALDDGGSPNGGQAGGGISESEEELLSAFNDRRSSGGSGYLDSDGTYVVNVGDTLTKVSHATGFSVDFLAAYNQLENKNMIITGESLRYPAK